VDSAILARRLGSRTADLGRSRRVGLGSGAPIGIYTDNPELAEYAWEHFHRDCDTIRGRGIETGPPVPARFVEVCGGDRFHRICVAATTTIELEWREVLDCFQVATHLAASRPPSSPAGVPRPTCA
jgi:hypothetical protein